MAGGIASLWQALPDATNEDIKNYVRMSASQYTTPDFFTGYGIPNLQLALDIGLSLQEEQRSKVSIYPNPTAAILNIDRSVLQDNITLRIYDVFGKSVLEQNIISSTQIDVSKLSAGLYMLSFQSRTAIQTIKLIKL